MKIHYSFLAVFEPSSSGYGVMFPDLPGCITVGDNFQHANTMAKEVLELHLWGMEDDNDPIPEPSDPSVISLADYEPGAFISLIDVYMPPVRDEMQNKSSAKNVTLPYWLKKAAEERHLNFSQLLATAIKQELGIIER